MSARQLEPSSTPHHLHFLQLPLPLHSPPHGQGQDPQSSLEVEVVGLESGSQAAAEYPEVQASHPLEAAPLTFVILIPGPTRWLPGRKLVPIFLEWLPNPLINTAAIY